MILDLSLAFDGPNFGAITTTRDSLNTIDLGVARDISIGEPLRLLFLSNRLFSGGTSVIISVEGSDAESSGFVVYAQSPALTTVQLNSVPGLLFPIHLPRPPFGSAARPRYLKTRYVVDGTYSAGAIQAYLTPWRDDVLYYPSAINVANV